MDAFAPCIFVGVSARSNEVIVATKKKLECARFVRQILVDEGWVDDCVEWVQWGSLA